MLFSELAHPLLLLQAILLLVAVNALLRFELSDAQLTDLKQQPRYRPDLY